MEHAMIRDSNGRVHCTCGEVSQRFGTAANAKAYERSHRAEAKRKRSLLDEVKAMAVRVAFGEGMALDNEHAQAVIDALVELDALRERATLASRE